MTNKKYGMSANQISRYGFKLCLEVYEKYDRKCSECGSEDYLAIHHIDGRGRNYENMGKKPNNSLDNLQLMCRVCHGRLHGSYSGYGLKRNKGQAGERQTDEQRAEYRKRYYQNNKEKWEKYRGTDRRKEYQKEYSKAYNKTEKYKEYQKEYSKTEKYKKRKREYYQNNKEKFAR